ncbi:phage head-tail connector protein [Acetobacter farinalis]|uniref:Phage head-tail connector protein n=1 Tax=Acetobacter farinalis TaxID=1260984 RepID=A0ABT3Q5K4_9PROT|nr:phage head-tail connector protein [Acetobacter farinalis]MCX2560555.1 phage head-tail connector protein [Acetobacter farinalis]NHO29304.1 hypothetical protein [Acetobacter farinalis]
MTNTNLISTLRTELDLPDDSRDDRLNDILTQAWGIASDYCQQDLTTLSPVPQTVTRTVLDIAAAIYHQAGRDRSITEDTCEGVGSTSFGLTRWTDQLTGLDPWRVYYVA